MDYAKALADGHSPEEVMGELSRRGVKMDYKRALADKHDPMEILKEMNRRQTGGGAPAPDYLSSHTPGGQKFKTPLSMQIADKLPSRKTVAKYARPVLEGVGMGAGGAVGAVAGAGTGGVTIPFIGAIPGAVAGGVAGSSLGFAAGSQLADMIEGPDATKVRLPATPDSLEMPKYRNRTVGEEVSHQANKLITGAEMEMGGQVVGKLAGTVVNKIAGTRTKGVPLSDTRARYKAAQEFAASQEESDVVKATSNQKRQDTGALLNRLGTDTTPSPGQAGNYHSAAVEQSMTSKDPTFAERMAHNDATLRGAATTNLTNKLGKAADLPQVQPRDVTGANIVGAIEKSQAPVKVAEGKAWAEVPDYPMPLDNFGQTSRTITADATLPGRTRKAIRTVLKHSESVPHTSDAMQGIEQTINDEMSVAAGNNDKGTMRVLKQLKESLAADANTLGEAADRGDIALSGGKVIMPTRIQGEIANLDEQIAAAQTAPASLKDQNAHLRDYLAGKGETVMQNTGVTDQQYNKSLQQRLAYVEKKGGAGRYTPPTAEAAANPVLDNLTARRAGLQATLDAAEPAENVATAYSAAKRYSKEEKFDRFYRGAVQDVLASGEQATGRQVTNEQVPARFFTRQGSKDLGVALMPPKGMTNPETGEVFTLPERITAGKQAAAEQMMPHVTEQLISKTVDANTGVMNIPRAMAFMRQNGDVLNELGLTKSVQRVIKGQLPRAIETELESRGVDIIGHPAMTALQAGKMIRRMGPAVSKLYGEDAMTALRDYGQMMEILGRNKNVSYSKGSTTAEKLNGDMVKKIGESAAGLVAVTGGHGWIFSSAKNLIKGIFEPALALQRNEMNKLLQEALMNPAAAEALMKVAKAKPADVSAVATKYLTPFIRQMQLTPGDKDRKGLTAGVRGIGSNAAALGTAAAQDQLTRLKAVGKGVGELVSPGEAGAAEIDKSKWSKRVDGSDKGNGYLGVMKRPDGKVSSEISIGVNIGGKEVELPTMVPTLTKKEINYLLENPVDDKLFTTDIGKGIKKKAIDHARFRLKQGKSPFAD